MSNKEKLSAVVVTYNEASTLDRCLSSLSSCDEIIVVDVGSSDDSLKIARKHTRLVYEHAHVDIVEKVRQYTLDKARNPWVLTLDPDEEASPRLIDEIKTLINSKEADQYGLIDVPCLYYFRKHRLFGTFWGGNKNIKPAVLHKDRLKISGNVHSGITLKNRYNRFKIEPSEYNWLHHFWATSWSELIEKHKRYIGNEGKAQYQAGGRFSWPIFLVSFPRKFNYSFIKRNGWKDGLLGAKLSLFYAWYVSSSLWSLKNYSARMRK